MYFRLETTTLHVIIMARVKTVLTVTAKEAIKTYGYIV